MIDRLDLWRGTKLWYKVEEDGLHRDSNVYFKDPIVELAYDALKDYFSSDAYLMRERIRTVEKIAMWENSHKNSRFDYLKNIRTYLDNSAYDLFEELVKNLGCRYVDARRVFKNIAVHIQPKCIQVINKNHGYKILESIMEERSLSYDRLHDINIRIQF